MSESFEDRLARDRAQRKSASDKAQSDKAMARAKADADRKYTNPVRREEAVRRFEKLRSPSQPETKSSAPDAPPVSGEPIEFYVYKDGKLETLKLLAVK